MAFKIGSGSVFPTKTVIDNDGDVNLHYADSIAEVTFEDGNMVMDLSKGNIFRSPTLYEPTNHSAVGGDAITDEFSFHYKQKGRNLLLPAGAKLTIKNWPDPGEVKTVSLAMEYVPRFQRRTDLDVSGSTQMISMSDSCQYKFNYFDLLEYQYDPAYVQQHQASLLSQKDISAGADSGGFFVVEHIINPTAAQNPLPLDLEGSNINTLAHATQKVKFYPTFMDSSDESRINNNHERMFYGVIDESGQNIDRVIYLNNKEENTFVKFRFAQDGNKHQTAGDDFTRIDKTLTEHIDYTSYTSNTSPDLRMPVFANDGYYLFAMDYGMSGTGSNAYGIQSFRMSTPYDLSTIYEGKWHQLSNGIISYIQTLLVEPNGKDIFLTNLVNYTYIRLGTPFDIDTVDNVPSTNPLPQAGGGTIDQNPENVQFAVFCGLKGQTLLHLETGGASADRRFYLTDAVSKFNALPDYGGMTHLTYDSAYYDPYNQFRQSWMPLDDKIKVSPDLVRADSSTSNGALYYGVKGQLEYPAPEEIHYYEFLVFDSAQGAIITNHVTGRNNQNPEFTSGSSDLYGAAFPGEAVFTEPGTYKFYFPPGVANFSAVAIGGGCGGGSGRQDVVAQDGDAKTGDGGNGGGGGMLAYKNSISVPSHGYVYVRVGAGGAAPYTGQALVSTDTANAGGDSFIEATSTSLVFYTPELKASGGIYSGFQPTGTGDTQCRGGAGGRVLSNAAWDIGSFTLCGGGGGGGAGGYIQYTGSENGSGGDFTTSSSSFYFPKAGNYTNDGDGGGGGGAGAYYRTSTTNRYAYPGQEGGGTGIYGTKYMRDTATTQKKIAGDEGENGTKFYDPTNVNFREGTEGSAGAHLLGSSTVQNYGAGGGGNAFQHDTNQGQVNSSLFGGTAGTDGAVRIVWGNISYGQTTIPRTFPSQNVTHEHSSVIYVNPGKLY